MSCSKPFRLILLVTLGMRLLEPHAEARNSKSASVSRLFDAWDRDDSPGAAVVVVQNGAVVYLRGFGCANLEHHVPITPQTSFDVASVAKQFTGLAVAMLTEQRKLSLEDEIHKFLPEVP